jgi:hypothetical protein
MLNRYAIKAFIIVLLFFSVLSPVFAKTYDQGIIIVFDSKNPKMEIIAEKVKDAIVRIREANKELIMGRNPLIKQYDVSEPMQRQFVQEQMGLSQSKLPAVGLARINKDGSFTSFETDCVLINVDSSIKSAETIMEKFKSFQPPAVKRNYASKLLTGFKLIDTNPPGAEVYINDKLWGTTEKPLKKVLFPPGEHKIRIQIPNYQPYEETILFEYGTYLEFQKDLQWPVGTLKLSVEPKGSHIFIDGKFVSKTSVYVPDISSGTHALMIKLPGYLTVNENVFVKGNKDGNVITDKKIEMQRLKVRYYLKLRADSSVYEPNKGTGNFTINDMTIKPKDLETEILRLLNNAPPDFFRMTDEETADLVITYSLRSEDKCFSGNVEVNENKSKLLIYSKSISKDMPPKTPGYEKEFIKSASDIFNEALSGKQLKTKSGENSLKPEDPFRSLQEDTIMRALYQRYDTVTANQN